MSRAVRITLSKISGSATSYYSMTDQDGNSIFSNVYGASLSNGITYSIPPTSVRFTITNVTTGVSQTYTNWNASDKSANVTLSADSLTTSFTSTFAGVRSVMSMSLAERKRFQIKVNALGTDYGNTCAIGVCNNTLSLSDSFAFGGSTTSWGIIMDTANVNKTYNGIYLGVGGGIAVNDIIDILIDGPNSSLHVYVNNVELNSGLPIWTNLTGVLYAYAGSWGESTGNLTANFGDTPFVYTYSGYTGLVLFNDSTTQVFNFNNTLAGTNGGRELLQVFDTGVSPAGVPGTFSSEFIWTTSGTSSGIQNVFTFSQNAGLSYANGFITNTYTIHILYKINDYNVGSFQFQKVLDFTNGTDDPGLYSGYNSGAPCLFNVYYNPGIGANAITSTSLTNSQYNLVSLVRGTTGSLDVYLNGIKRLSGYDDSVRQNYMVSTSSTPIIFFRDDVTAPFPGEAGAGAVKYISLSRHVSTSTEVSNDYTSIISSLNDSDVSAFISAAGLTSSIERTAIATLVSSLKSASLWTSARAIYPFVGGTTASCKWNLKDPRDLDIAYRLNIIGSPVITSNGMQPTGTDYADTMINDSTLTYNSNSIGYYSRTNNIIGSADMGVSDATSPYNHLWINYNTGVLGAWWFQGGGNVDAVVTDTRGLFTVTSGATVSVYRNSTSIGSTSPTPTNTNVNDTILIGSARTGGSGGRQCAFAYVYDIALSSSQVTSIYTIIQNFQTSLGRQV